jgi:hypothetical protein
MGHGWNAEVSTACSGDTGLVAEAFFVFVKCSFCFSGKSRPGCNCVRSKIQSLQLDIGIAAFFNLDHLSDVISEIVISGTWFSIGAFRMQSRFTSMGVPFSSYLRHQFI